MKAAEAASSNRIQDLLVWAQEHGAFLHDSVEIHSDPTHGLCFRVKESVRPVQFKLGSPPSSQKSTATTTDDLLPYSRIVSCPLPLSLSYFNALSRFPDLPAHASSRSALLPDACFQRLSPKVIGHFFLVQQFLEGESSFWAPYVKALPQPDEPRKLGTPLYFENVDLAWIKGTDLEGAREARERLWREEWEAGMAILREVSIEGGAKVPRYWEQATWELYKWAATIFSSRSFVSNLIPPEVFQKLTPPIASGSAQSTSYDKHTVKRRPAPGSPSDCFFSGDDRFAYDTFAEGPVQILLPLLDIGNHSPTARVTWFTDVMGEPKDVCIIADQAISAGAQIFNNYGPKNNTELLLGYGFVIADNDVVSIEIKKPPLERLQYYQEQRPTATSPASSQYIFHLNASADVGGLIRTKDVLDMFSPGCINLLALLVANDRELAFLKNNPQVSLEQEWGSSKKQPLSRLGILVLSTLWSKLNLDLQKILMLCPSNTQGYGSGNQRTAVIYRKGQERVLRLALTRLKRYFDAVLSISDRQLAIDNSLRLQHNVKIISIQDALGWLHEWNPSLWTELEDFFRQELELELAEISNISQETFDIAKLREVVDEGWEFTIWCIWLYVATTIRLDKAPDDRGLYFRDWVMHMIDYTMVHSSDEAGSPVLHGQPDEQEVLKLFLTTSTAQSLGDENTISSGSSFLHQDVLTSPRHLMSWVSRIVEEELFLFDTTVTSGHSEASETDLEPERVAQLVLCLGDQQSEQ